jgi:hypothetical protein
MVKNGDPRHGYNTTLGSGALEPLAKSQATNHCGNSSVGKLFMLAGIAIPTPVAGAKGRNDRGSENPRLAAKVKHRKATGRRSKFCVISTG